MFDDYQSPNFPIVHHHLALALKNNNNTDLCWNNSLTQLAHSVVQVLSTSTFLSGNRFLRLLTSNCLQSLVMKLQTPPVGATGRIWKVPAVSSMDSVLQLPSRWVIDGQISDTFLSFHPSCSSFSLSVISLHYRKCNSRTNEWSICMCVCVHDDVVCHRHLETISCWYPH